MFKFLERLKCRLKVCCSTSVACGEEEMKRQDEEERKKYIQQEVESFRKKNYLD